MVSALPPGLVQNQVPAVDSGQQILVLPETTTARRHEQLVGGGGGVMTTKLDRSYDLLDFVVNISHIDQITRSAKSFLHQMAQDTIFKKHQNKDLCVHVT